jgi:gamma-glutamylcyclotransferase (GGCT)/AIG2-like uncharacterized protein YtfP
VVGFCSYSIYENGDAMSDQFKKLKKLKKLKYHMQYGELFGSSVEYPVIKTVDGKVVGMCLEKDSPYVHAFVAAPEMLEALKKARQYVYWASASGYADAVKMNKRIESLIARAEGRQS